MKRHSHGSLHRVAFMLLLSCSIPACKVTSEKIQKWKRTERGPAKLRAAVRDADLTLALRSEAALALTDLGLSQPLSEDFRALNQSDRSAIGENVVDELAARLKGSPSATTSEQLSAKDALFGLRSALDGKQQRRVDSLLARWIVSDWPSRGRGEHSADKVIAALPSEVSGPILASAVTNDPDLVAVLAGQVRKVGRPTDRRAAAEGLVELARSEKPIAARTLEALGRVGDEKSRRFLLELGQSSANSLEQRILALQALALDPSPALVEPLARLAGDSRDEKGVRGAAFQALEAIAGEGTISALGAIIGKDRNETVRFRAVEALVRCCGVDGLPKLLESLPTGYTYAKADVADFLEADIKGLGQEALPVLRKVSKSGSWIARLVAIRVLGDIGTEGDVTALEALASDTTSIRGWEKGATLGAEARAAAARIKERK
jgi:HEAT repeat protein